MAETMTRKPRPQRGDVAAVARIVKAAGSSFRRGMAVLPRRRRQAMFAVYAFCRVVDDIADGDAPLAEKRAALAAWRGQISALYAGKAEDAVTRELRRAVIAFDLREADFQAVIDGMAMDAEGPVVAPREAELDLYCDRVAAAVGRLSVRCFGDASPAADRVAFHLGRALQLTNILRDLHEDVALGRLYLPRELLEMAGIPLSPKEALAHPATERVCAELARRARGHFGEAEVWMSRCNEAAMRPARLMADTYEALLDVLRERGWRDLHRRVRLSPWAKLRILWRHLMR
jgi:phytoene synthase